MRRKVPVTGRKIAVLFLGNKKSGKDTAANVLGVNLQFKKMALFEPPKQLMSRLLGVSYSDLVQQGPTKEKHTKQMQDLGTALQTIFGRDVLSESLLNCLREVEIVRLAVSDTRIREDLDNLRSGLTELGYKVVVCGLARPGTFEYNGHTDHYSEDLNRATSDLIANGKLPEWCDCAIQNDRNFEDFVWDVLRMGGDALAGDMPRMIYGGLPK